MKHLLSFSILGFLILTLISCGKDDSPGELVGNWNGHWGFDFETPDVPERWELKQNGDLTAYDDDGELYAHGTWEVDGSNFNASYTTLGSENEYSFSGLYHVVAGEIIGTWGESPSTANGGTFEMYKE